MLGMADRAKILKLLETADNFIKYGGNSNRSTARARKRYEQAAELASMSDEVELAERAALRLQDIASTEALGPGESFDLEDDATSVLLSELPEHAQERVPPGQRVKKGWPVLHEGPIPRFDPETWRFKVWGEVDAPVELTYRQLQELPNVKMRSDFHCVTGWSKLDNLWDGVQTAELLKLVGPNERASHVLVHAEYGYTANLPLGVLLEDESMLTWAHNGENLAPKHGFPLRLLVPRLYAWKSVKWVRGIELLDADQRGFWEVRGYHNRADPWLEERYSYQERA
jgi:DMSO/TMAO reductase YedYZ molybdopterin-dependent catalytic subunit